MRRALLALLLVTASCVALGQPTIHRFGSGIQSGTAFPASPVTGDLFIITDDSVAGACDSSAGAAKTLCRWSGSAWEAIGDGQAAGGTLTAADIDTSAELAGIVTNETGTGALVFANTPTLVTPILGTPTSGTLTNTTGFPAASLAGAGAGVLTWIATPSSANLISAVTDETGSGALVFATTPTLVTPILGTPTSGTLTNTTGFPTANLAGAGAGVLTFLATPSSANLAAAVTGETGSGALVFDTSPTITTPTISGAITFPDNVRQTFNPGADAAGLNVGAIAGDPGTPSNGDLWYDSTANELTARINGANVALGAGGAGGAPTDATYIVQTANGSLSAEQALSSLSTGIMRVATTTGVITSLTDSAGIAANLSDETGSGALVFANTPTLVTPVIGAATGTSLVLSGNITAANLTPSGTLTDENLCRYDSAGPTVECTTNTRAELVAIVTDLDSGTRTATNLTLDAEGTGNVVTLPLYKDFPAAGCNNATATSFWDLPTSSPAVPACRTGTNTQKGTLDFADGSSLTAQSFFKLPTGWTGNIDAVVTWISSTTTGDVVWQIAIACAGDADSDDPAFTDDVFTADTTKGTGNQLNDTASNTVTTTGTCAAGDIAHIRIKRDSAHASDTMAGTARLVNLQLTYRVAH